MPKNLSANGAANAKKITQAFSGIAALTLAAGGGLVFWLNAQITAGQTLRASRESQVGSSEQVAKRLDMTKATYDQTKSRIAMLEASVAEKSFVPTLLQQLQALAGATHLTVSQVSPSAIVSPAAAAPPAKPPGDAGTTPAAADAGKAKAAPPYDTLSVALTVAGTYADTVTFLYDLTRFPKIISVEGAQLHPGGGPTDGDKQGADKKAAPQVTTQLKLTAFVFHDDGLTATTPPAAGGAVPAASVVPPTGTPNVAGAAGRAAQGAVTAVKAVGARGQAAVSTL